MRSAQQRSPSRSRVSIPKNGRNRKSNAVAAGAAALDIARIHSQLRKDPKAGAKYFWELLKSLTISKFGDTESTFRAFCCPKDGLLSSLQFQDMCESLGLQIAPGTLRALFESRLRDHEVAWSLQDFQDILMFGRLDAIRTRLQEYNRSVKRIASHVDTFIKRLSLESGEVNRRRSVARLQAKLVLPFCADLWAGLQKHVARRPGRHENDVDAIDFIHVAETAATFQGYELNLMRNLFDRIDRSRCGRVNISDLAVAMALIGTAWERYDKVRFLFYVFDSDGDGCLTSEQILRFYCSVAIHGVIARGDQPSYDADVALGDELSLAKARRLYDFTVLNLHQSGVNDLCTFQEMWSVLEAHPFLLEELVPGIHRIMWVLRSVAPMPVRQAEIQRRVILNKKKEPADERKESKRTTIGVEVGTSVQRSLNRSKTWHAPAGTVPVLSKGRAGPSMPLCLNRAEHFRVQAAVRFRHAVRGEWDVVNSLQNMPPPQSPQSREMHTDGASSKLPAIADGGSSDRSPSASWAEECSTFERRQKQNHWHSSHRQSLTSWSRGGFQPEEDLFPSRSSTARSKQVSSFMQQSKSMPSLNSSQTNALESPLAAMKPEELKAAADAKIAEVSAQAARVLEAEPTDAQRFGRQALTRIRHLEQALSASAAHHHRREGPVEKIAYKCHLCGSGHDMSVPCLF